MTNYNLKPLSNLPSLAIQEAKERRRQVLARAAEVRKANFQRLMQKQRAAHRDEERQGI